MVEIGGRPILWHIMMHYAHFGYRQFVIALGYKGEYIKKYMVDYCSLHNNLRVNLRTGMVSRNGDFAPDWDLDLIDTGGETQTGGRIKRLAPYLSDSTFLLTWGDGVSDVDINKLVGFHRSHGRLATLTAVRPPARFGHLALEGSKVAEFSEKNQTKEGWINGAFFVLEPQVFDYIDADDTHWEREPLERLAREGQLMAYRHTSFWQCMDTVREKRLLEELWATGSAPWKLWEEGKYAAAATNRA
jgi:glucose-1-phosphate cytidylyltransferase